jgi:hypothetical protein
MKFSEQETWRKTSERHIIKFLKASNKILRQQEENSALLIGTKMMMTADFLQQIM